MSPRDASRSRMRSPVVPAEPSMNTFADICALLLVGKVLVLGGTLRLGSACIGSGAIRLFRRRVASEFAAVPVAAVAVPVAVPVAVTVALVGRTRAERRRVGYFHVVHDNAEDVRAGLGERTRAVLDRLEVRSVGAAHDDDGIDLDGERHHVAHDAERRRVDDDPVVVLSGPLEEIRNNLRTEDRAGRDTLRRQGGDHVETFDGRLVHELREVYLGAWEGRTVD